MPPITPLGERLRELRKSLGDPDREAFASTLGVSKTTLGNYEKGVSEPTASVLDRYRQVHKASLLWIVSGEGRMFVDDAEGHGKRAGTPLNEELFSEIKRIVKSAHSEAGVILSPLELDRKTIDIYNAYIVDDTDMSDGEEMGLWLSLMEKRLKRELAAAVKAPGTGKREAS